MLISVEARRQQLMSDGLPPLAQLWWQELKQCHNFLPLNAVKSVCLSQGMTWLQWTHQPLQSQSQKEMSGGRKVSNYLFPEILIAVTAVLDTLGMHYSSLADVLLCAFQSVINEGFNCSSPMGWGLRLLPHHLSVKGSVAWREMSKLESDS